MVTNVCRPCISTIRAFWQVSPSIMQVRYDMDPDVVLSINDFVFTLGELKVSNGILKVVTAKSGHYKPRRLQVGVGLC